MDHPVYPTRCNVTQFILSGNCSTCFGWYLYPSSGAQTTLSTFRICHTVSATCRYHGRDGTGLSVLWVAYATHSTAVTVWQIPDAVDTVVCALDDGWKYHPKHVDPCSDINKLCNVASCWIYIGILLGAHYILHISRIRVKECTKLQLHISQLPSKIIFQKQNYWYICWVQLGWHTVAVVQYTFTHKQYIEQHS